MNRDDHNPPPQESNSEALDDLISRALAVEADSPRVERLEQFWRNESRRRANLRWTIRVAGLLAASVLIAGVVVFSRSRSDDESNMQVSRTPETVQQVEPAPPIPPPPAPEASPVKPEVIDARSAGREPTEYERLMFAALTRKRTRPATPTPAEDQVVATVEPKVTPKIDATLSSQELVAIVRAAEDEPVRRSLLEQLLATESESALVAYLFFIREETLRNEAIAVAVESPEFPLDRLIALLDHDNDDIRMSAAMLLAAANRCEMTEPLIARIHERPSGSVEAWFTLFTCRCERADEFLAYASRRPQLLGQFNNARLQWERMVQ